MSVTREAMARALQAVPLRTDTYRNGVSTWERARPDYLALADAALALLRTLPRYNCDCLPAGPDGQPQDGGIYCEREVILASDLP